MLLRYADILLMYAEAKNELGEMSEEIWNRTVKAIRQRAGFTTSSAWAYPGGDADEIRRQIRYERRVELAGEGTYYNDLRRWREAENAMNNLSIYKSDGTLIGTRNFNKERDYWWPVPSRPARNSPDAAAQQSRLVVRVDFLKTYNHDIQSQIFEILHRRVRGRRVVCGLRGRRPADHSPAAARSARIGRR